jgi:hypothetical protein
MSSVPWYTSRALRVSFAVCGCQSSFGTVSHRGRFHQKDYRPAADPGCASKSRQDAEPHDAVSRRVDVGPFLLPYYDETTTLSQPSRRGSSLPWPDHLPLELYQRLHRWADRMLEWTSTPAAPKDVDEAQGEVPS